MILPHILNTIWWIMSYVLIMSQCDLIFDLKINVGKHDLHFMVKWFCLISWRLLDGWASSFELMSRCGTNIDLIYVGSSVLYFTVQWFCFYIQSVSWINVSWMNAILWNEESVWCNDRPHNKCRSWWPIFHCPLSVPYLESFMDELFKK